MAHRQVAQTFGTTINDVLVNVVAGVIRSLLQKRRDLCESDPWSTIPVNLRQVGDTELGMKVAQLPSCCRALVLSILGLISQIGFVYLRIPIALEDPIERLREIKRRMDLLKLSPEIYFNRWLQVRNLPTD